MALYKQQRVDKNLVSTDQYITVLFGWLQIHSYKDHYLLNAT